MEAVAPHAGIRQRAGQRESLRRPRHRPVEGGIEARHLRQAGAVGQQGLHRQQVGRLVQRGQRHQRLEPRHDLRRDAHRRHEIRATVDHAMPDGSQGASRIPGIEPLEQEGQRNGMVDAAVPRALHRDRAGGLADRGTGMVVQLFDDALFGPRQHVAEHEDLELQARRARVQHEDRVRHQGRTPIASQHAPMV